ncbi:HNH endonuclease family protein [Enterovibrio norvegicus]|uniref:hypothetical protein n=1 Tax=Enterovibrio norvegicus TaxID=188144 RepID=UPI00354D4E05
MIKINHSFTIDFLTRYEEYVITNRAIPSFHKRVLNAQGITQVERDYIRILFTDEFIYELVFCNAEQLYQKIETVYNYLPILAERYCLEYYLKDINLTPKEALMPIGRKADKSEIRRIYARVIADLQLLSDNNQSILLPVIINEIKVTEKSKASDIKHILKKINSMKLGHYKLTEEIVALYPNWVAGFDSVFNYEAMSTNFGHEITKNMDLDICPYCNNEDIETITEKGAETRPDLDHFYPKSKFPFLATTLFNLVPAGSRCNQSYKKSTSMFGYIHPRVDGINQSRLFDFFHTPGKGHNPDNLKIKTIRQNNPLDKNLDLFKIEAAHNKHDVKKWFLRLDERYQLILNSENDKIKEILDNEKLICLRLDIDVKESPKKEKYQKLKIDALNFLSGRDYKIKD